METNRPADCFSVLIPYEDDEVTRLILDSHARAAFAAVSGLTVGEFRDWLLRYETTSETLTALAPGLTPEMVAAVAKGWRIAPVVIATQSRVALGDEIGEVLGAPQTAILIGERPGLSAADSLGIYLTYGPRVGRVDAERNCLSNIRPEGLSYEGAATQLVRLMHAARQAGQTGVGLKMEP